MASQSFCSHKCDWASAIGTVTDILPPKQPFWDRHSSLVDLAQVKCSLSMLAHLHSFLDASSPHSGDWLLAMWVEAWWWSSENCSRSAAWLVSLCSTKCIWNLWFVCRDCKKAPGRSARHHIVNDLVSPSLWFLLVFHAPRLTWS